MFSLFLTVYLRYLCLYFGHVLLPTSPHRERDWSSPGRFTPLACQCVKYFVLPIYKFLFVSPWVTKNLNSSRAFSSLFKPVFLLNQVIRNKYSSSFCWPQALENILPFKKLGSNYLRTMSESESLISYFNKGKLVLSYIHLHSNKVSYRN